jgi:hypothetical protein
MADGLEEANLRATGHRVVGSTFCGIWTCVGRPKSSSQSDSSGQNPQFRIDSAEYRSSPAQGRSSAARPTKGRVRFFTPSPSSHRDDRVDFPPHREGAKSAKDRDEPARENPPAGLYLV